MRRLPLLLSLAAVSTIPACKGKDKPKSGEQAAAARPAVADAAPPSKPLIAPAARPGPATDEACQEVATFFEPGFRAAAGALEVPEPQVAGVAKQLGETFVARCRDEDWPENLLTCLGRQTADIFTYRRCFDRLPTARREAWTAYVYDVAAKAGGKQMPAPDPVAPVEGKLFEDVCADFVAEVARFDGCASGAMYLPEVEELHGERRRVEVGGVVPTAEIESLAKHCAQRAESTRRAATTFCKNP